MAFARTWGRVVRDPGPWSRGGSRCNRGLDLKRRPRSRLSSSSKTSWPPAGHPARPRRGERARAAPPGGLRKHLASRACPRQAVGPRQRGLRI